MAAREFHGIIRNEWESPLIWSQDDVDSGEWQDPWYPSRKPGAGEIAPQGQGEWRSESDGVLTGTSGWARWGVRVFDVFDGDHFEFAQVNWNVPFLQTDYPNITCAVFRNNPAETDAFAVPDPKPPFLELVPAVMGPDGTAVATTSSDGNPPALAQAGQIAPYVLAVPVSFFLTPLFGPVTHPRVPFVLRKRQTGQAQGRLSFPTSLPSREQMAMAAFRSRVDLAGSLGFPGGFPNFYESKQARNNLGGTVFLTQAATEWQDIPLSELGNPPLEDFAVRMRATNSWAVQHGFAGGVPTFYHVDHGSGAVCGAFLVKAEAAEVRDVPVSELGGPALDDIGARFRATQDYATKNGFVGGFPTFHDSKASNPFARVGHRSLTTVCGTVLLKRGEVDFVTGLHKPTYAARRDVLLSQDPA